MKVVNENVWIGGVHAEPSVNKIRWKAFNESKQNQSNEGPKTWSKETGGPPFHIQQSQGGSYSRRRQLLQHKTQAKVVHLGTIRA